jgi:hypothetical protein
MRFGKSAAEAAEEPNRAGGGGDFIRYLKEGDNTFRILQEPDEWVYYWEHFSPMGFSFPCNNEDDCPGCTSDNEKMKKVTRKIAFNALNSFNGVEYVNAWKIGTTVADKLENRYKRFGTVTDRDYTITRYKSSGDRWDFDVEGSTPTPVDKREEEWKDIEELLQRSWDEAWGDPKQAEANTLGSAERSEEEAPAPRAKRPTIAPQKKDEEPPSEPEVVYQESDLRAMDHGVLVKLVKAEMDLTPPASLKTSDQVVDWMMDLQS